MRSRRKVRCRSFGACWQATSAAWWLREATANLPDRSHRARWKLSGSRERLEDSSGNRRRLGHITKQGSSIMRFLLVEAAQVTARSLPEWRSKYLHLMMRRGRKIAKVA